MLSCQGLSCMGPNTVEQMFWGCPPDKFKTFCKLDWIVSNYHLKEWDAYICTMIPKFPLSRDLLHFNNSHESCRSDAISQQAKSLIRSEKKRSSKLGHLPIKASSVESSSREKMSNLVGAYQSLSGQAHKRSAPAVSFTDQVRVSSTKDEDSIMGPNRESAKRSTCPPLKYRSWRMEDWR